MWTAFVDVFENKTCHWKFWLRVNTLFFRSFWMNQGLVSAEIQRFDLSTMFIRTGFSTTGRCQILSFLGISNWILSNHLKTDLKYSTCATMHFQQSNYLLAVGSNSIKTELRIVRVLEKKPIQKRVVEKH